ncbi:FAD-dependent oxidoreductase [Deinococcus malanensis]|uniref:FAD-dependent oxidoreductase n=1 Tax=Deinococcus malanensis TaxID=1706855 RepID=UPI0016653753|nr:FAD-dependent oxidoreductase [Deinococcus malanensis]
MGTLPPPDLSPTPEASPARLTRPGVAERTVTRVTSRSQPASRRIGCAQPGKGTWAFPQTFQAGCHVDPVKFGVQVTGVHAQGDMVLVMAVGPAGDALTFPAQAVIVALPPRLAEQTITFMPELPPALTQVLSDTSTWMGHAMKAVVRYERAFWRAQGLSGFAVNYAGGMSGGMWRHVWRPGRTTTW